METILRAMGEVVQIATADARQMKDFFVNAIDLQTASPFLLKRHYLKRLAQTKYLFGIYKNNLIRGVICYGIPSSNNLCEGIAGRENKNLVIELNRLITDEGRVSWFISESIRLIPKPKIIVSYADTEMGHIGYAYQSANFIYTGLTKERTDKFSEKHSRHADKDETRRKKRGAKHRYVFLHGTKKQKKYLLKSLNYTSEPYPKGETNNYFANQPINQQMVLF
jgi:hypothetical protein